MIVLRIFNTPVKVKATVLPILILLWGGLTWYGLSQHPERGFGLSLLIGLAVSILLVLADFGHALAHIISARIAGAPMDKILIAGDMPRTIYHNNDVAPAVHRQRALGGPVFNTIGLLLSLAVFALVRGSPVAQELMAFSAIGHGLLLIMSMFPLPMVDGGTILKWSLVSAGRTPAQAERFVRGVDWVLGAVLVLTGIALLVMQLWIVGLILLGGGMIVVGAAAGMIK
jgi:hypothetical protein